MHSIVILFQFWRLQRFYRNSVLLYSAVTYIISYGFCIFKSSYPNKNSELIEQIKEFQVFQKSIMYMAYRFKKKTIKFSALEREMQAKQHVRVIMTGVL